MNEFYVDYRYAKLCGSNVGAWLYWLRAWLLCFVGVYSGTEGAAPEAAPHKGRQERRMDRHFCVKAVPAARDLSPFYSLLPRGLTRAQFMERMARISVLGRVRTYCLRYWGSVLRRRAALTCYDHGWWRAPAGGPRSLQEPASLRPP